MIQPVRHIFAPAAPPRPFQGPNGPAHRGSGHPGAVLPEALALAAVRRLGPDLPVVVDHVVGQETLGEFAGLGVAQPDPVAGPQVPGGRRSVSRPPWSTDMLAQ